MAVSLCLNMIVKNESKNLPRLFDSIADLIDDYVICDTGSTDNTVEVIKNYWSAKNIEGYVGYEPFKDFGHNRNVALTMAKTYSKSTHLLLVDADMVVRRSPSFDKNCLANGTVFSIKQKSCDLEYSNTRIVSRTVYSKCVGVTHEYYDVDKYDTRKDLDTIWIEDIGDGGCKDNKFERDVKLLTQGIIDEPKNGRYHFYLAQSYKDSKRWEEALRHYRRRIEIGGWDEEIWYSHYMISHVYRNMNDDANADEWCHKAYCFRPSRAEPMYHMCKYYRIKSNHAKAFLYYNLGHDKPKPKDSLFVEHAVYSWLFDYEFSILQYYLFPDKRETGAVNSTKLLNYIDLPNHIHNSIHYNYVFYIPNLRSYSTRQVTFQTQDRRLTDNGDYLLSSAAVLDLGDTNILNVWTSNSDAGPSRYLVNGRMVNYRIQANGSYKMYKSGDLQNSHDVRTKNAYFYLDSDYNMCSEIGEMQLGADPLIARTGCRIYGLEDIRLYRMGDTIGFLAISVEFSYCNKTRIVQGTYDVKNQQMINCHYLVPPCNTSCEKNWVWCPSVDDQNKGIEDLVILYNWYPIQVGHLVPANMEVLRMQHGIESLKNGDDISNYRLLDIRVTHKDLPRIFSLFRGSSNGYLWKNMLWFVTHSVIVSDDSPRRYIHYIVALDATDYHLVAYSSGFHFEDMGIEYTLTLIVNSENIVIGYSRNDATSHLLMVPWKKLIPLMHGDLDFVSVTI